ncbi:MAG: endonuclease III [Bacteroidota bacterium]
MKTGTKEAKRNDSRIEGERKRAIKVLDILHGAFPEAHTALTHRSPFELLVATILSAQCTDTRVNIVTKDLFQKYRSAHDFAVANQSVLEEEVHSTGFFRMKAKNIIACSKALVEEFHGEVPAEMEKLVRLPGVGRKTANVILSEAFGKNEGVVVDTHVQRLSQRLGFTAHEDPVRIEEDLMALIPRARWGETGLVLILHGRKTCSARKPLCPVCEVAALCPSANSFEGKSSVKVRPSISKKTKAKPKKGK